MKKYLLALLLSASINAFGAAINYTDLQTAVKNKSVAVSPVAGGGLSNANLVLKIRNLLGRTLHLRIPPGLHFASEDPAAQDLFTYQQVLVALEANEERSLPLRGFCMEAADYSPSANARFIFKGFAALPLKPLADSLQKYRALADDYGQMFVWAITDGRSLYDISVDPALTQGAENVVRYVSAHHSRAGLANNTSRVRHRGPGHTHPTVKTFSKKAFLLFHNPVAQAVTLKLYDGQGREEHVFFENRRVQPGVLHYAFGLNETVLYDANPVYYYKLLNKDGKVLAQLKVDQQTEERDVSPQVRKFKFPFKLDQGVRESKIAIYLADGSLVEELGKYKYLPVGNFEFDLAFDHIFPADTRFVVKLVGENGTVYRQQDVPRP